MEVESSEIMFSPYLVEHTSLELHFTAHIRQVDTRAVGQRLTNNVAVEHSLTQSGSQGAMTLVRRVVGMSSCSDPHRHCQIATSRETTREPLWAGCSWTFSASICCSHPGHIARTMAADPARPDKSNKCWNCRRNRLKCDGTLPHCQKCAQRGAECPGYASKPLRWVSGVASRGQMMGRTYESKSPPPQASNKRPRSQLVISAYEPKKKKVNLGHSTSPPTPPIPTQTSPPTPNPPPTSPSISPSTSITTSYVALAPSKCLVEPMLQPLRYDDRYLLDYCKNMLSTNIDRTRP